MKKTGKARTLKVFVTLLLLFSIAFSSVQCVEAKTKTVSPFKTLKLGSFNLKKYANKHVILEKTEQLALIMNEKYYTYLPPSKIKAVKKV